MRRGRVDRPRFVIRTLMLSNWLLSHSFKTKIRSVLVLFYILKSRPGLCRWDYTLGTEFRQPKVPPQSQLRAGSGRELNSGYIRIGNFRHYYSPLFQPTACNTNDNKLVIRSVNIKYQTFQKGNSKHTLILTLGFLPFLPSDILLL